MALMCGFISGDKIAKFSHIINVKRKQVVFEFGLVCGHSNECYLERLGVFFI